MLEIGGFVPGPTKVVWEDVEKLLGTNECPQVAEFASLLNYVYRAANGPCKPGRYGGSMIALYKDMLVSANPDAGWTVINGGIAHRGQGINRLRPKMPMRQYYESMPLPDLTVMISADLDVIKERTRLKNLIARVNDIENAFELQKMSREILLKRGARILDIDTTSTPVEENVAVILGAFDVSDITLVAEKYQGEAASTYEETRTGQLKWASEKKILTEIIGGLDPGTAVLDIPCGTGRLHELLSHLNVIGMDVNTEMSDQAKAKGMSVRHGDVTCIPLGDKSVDVSFCIRLLNWLNEADARRALVELQRVTRKQITFTLRVAEHPRARAHLWAFNQWPLSLVNESLDGWRISANQHIDDGKPQDTFRMITLEPV